MKPFATTEMDGAYAKLFVEGVFICSFMISAEGEMVANNINMQLAARWKRDHRPPKKS